MGVQISIWVSVFNSLGHIPIQGIAGHMVILYLIFWDLPFLLPVGWFIHPPLHSSLLPSLHPMFIDYHRPGTVWMLWCKTDGTGPCLDGVNSQVGEADFINHQHLSCAPMWFPQEIRGRDAVITPVFQMRCYWAEGAPWPAQTLIKDCSCVSQWLS